MGTVTQSPDADLLELLRTVGPMDVAMMSGEIAVTPTAVRQRLSRLLAEGLVRREPIRAGRGRPKHRYQITDKGLRWTGSNFSDLALAMWRQIASIQDFQVRRNIFTGMLRSLAAGYSRQIEGLTVDQRMRSLVELLGERRVPFSVEQSADGLPVLTAHACPYPELADQDRTICALERILFSELIQQELTICQCRLDGKASCQFQPS